MKNEHSNIIFLSGGKLNIFNQDALDFLPKLENESIDLIYCDLPFGTTQCSWDEVIPFDKMWEQVIRIAKQNTPIVFHAQQPFTSALIMSNPKMFKYTWVWEKSKATGFLNAKKRPLVAHEDIVVFCKGTPVYYPQMTEGTAYNKGVRKQQTENDVYGSFEQVEVKSDGLRYPRSVQYFKTAESEGKTWHKTQKPKDLCKYIIETYSKQGDVVLDFTAGSGTSAIGIEIGRTVILVEKKTLMSLKNSKSVGKKNNNKIGKLWRRAGRIETLSDEFILICMEANMLEDMNFKIKDFKKKWIEDSKENLWHKVCSNL